MKQNANNKTGKNNRNNKNAKGSVRNARAARAAKGAAAVAVKPPMPRAQKLFIVLVALVCAFAISAAALGTIRLADVLSEVKYGSIYDKVDYDKYVKGITKADYTGLDIDLSGQYVKPYTIEDMDDYLKSQAFYNRKLIAAGQMTTAIGYGDDVSYYIVSILDENGNAVLENDFSGSNYSDAVVMTVGGENFGDDFDAKLIALNITPDMTERRLRLNGSVAATDVIALSYSAYRCSKNDTSKTDYSERFAWESKAKKELSHGRVDLSAADERLANAIAENCKEVGEGFSFILENYDIDGNGTIAKEEAGIKFEATVNFVAVKEDTVPVTFTLPSDYFDADSYSAEYTALNGKTVTFNLIVSRMDDYEVPAINASFIKETLKFETDKTADADVIEAYKQYSLETLNASLAESQRKAYYAAVFSTVTAPLYQNGYFGDATASSGSRYPQELIDEAYERAYNDLQSQYLSSGYSSSMSFEDYIMQYIYSQTGMQVQSASSGVSYMAEQRIVQELFIHWIFYEEGLKITDEMLEKAYRTYVDGLIESSSDPATYNEEYFVNLYGKDHLYSQARRTVLIYDMVGDYLLANNNIKYGS